MDLRLAPSIPARERRLERLLADRGLHRDDPRLARLVEDALLLGSLGLAGVHVPWDEARAGEAAAPPELAALRRARAAVAREDRLTLAAIRSWHEAIAGPAGFRHGEPEEAERSSDADGKRPAAPVEFIPDRLTSLFDWLAAAGSDELRPEQKAAVTLARIVEIRPFDDANGRVARLAAAHLLEREGLGPPILVAGDAARLRAALQAAFRLATGPLVELVLEASSRPLDVMIQSIERGLV